MVFWSLKPALRASRGPIYHLGPDLAAQANPGAAMCSGPSCSDPPPVLRCTLGRPCAFNLTGHGLRGGNGIKVTGSARAPSYSFYYEGGILDNLSILVVDVLALNRPLPLSQKGSPALYFVSASV